MSKNTTEPTLLPCPFCGSSCVNDTSPPENDGDHSFYWVCPDCVAVGPAEPSLQEATESWNTRASQWQPIETAPKDGSLCFIGRYDNDGAWNSITATYKKDGMFIDTRSWHSFYTEVNNLKRPTHWMPLPKPPSGGE